MDLEVLAQHGNNLILRDNNTGEPIQQIYGVRESERETGKGMTPWPTYRMSFRGFQKAFPEGTVFLNKPSKNPLLFPLDLFTETAFSGGIKQQHQQAKPVMDNMTRHDPRLPNKTYVWGVGIGDDAVCWTDDFITEQGGLLNETVGDRALVVYADPSDESIGFWYNDSGTPVTSMAFSDASDQGQLERVETLRSASSGMFGRSSSHRQISIDLPMRFYPPHPHREGYSTMKTLLKIGLGMGLVGSPALAQDAPINGLKTMQLSMRNWPRFATEMTVSRQTSSTSLWTTLGLGTWVFQN